MDSMQRNEISVQQLDMNNTLAIKLPIMDVPAKACMSLKKLIGLSLGEIKDRAAYDDYLFICYYADYDGLKLMSKIKREMKKLGIVVRQFENGVEKTLNCLTTSRSFIKKLTLSMALMKMKSNN